MWFWAEMYDALLAMTIPDNWEQVGTVTVEDTIFAASDMFRSLFMTVGVISAVAWATIPDGFLVCDGSTYARTDYPNLYAVLPAAFIIDADNFKVPDLQGITIIGTGAGFSSGDTGGESTHTLTVGEMPSHNHTTGNSLLIATATPPPFDVLGPNPIPAFTGNTGGDGSHNNMQPYLALTYVISAG
jgi:microcystin-dependent protein